MFRFLTRLLRSLFRNTIKAPDVFIPPDIINPPEVRVEEQWFKKSQNLMDGDWGRGPIISSSNFSSPPPRKANGDYYYQDDLLEGIELVNEYTDDVDLLKSDPNYAKPDYPDPSKNTIYKLTDNDKKIFEAGERPVLLDSLKSVELHTTNEDDTKRD